ncbi:glutathione synthetase-like [Ciona intestinalis]
MQNIASGVCVTKRMVDDAVDFAHASGIVMLNKPDESSRDRQKSSHAPFTMYPSSFSKSAVSQTQSVQDDIHSLFHKVSRDVSFLEEVLRSTIAVDSFVKNLFEIYKATLTNEFAQKVEIGIYRSDYMLQKSPGEPVVFLPKQIEINTMAASFFGIGTNKVKRLQQYNLRNASITCDNLDMPENGALDGIARVMVEGWKKYGNPEALFVFMINKSETNIYDQRAIEYAMYEYDPAVKVRRKVFNDCISTTRTDQDGKLFIDDEEVAVVYFRTCYMPDHFPTTKHWEVRKLIELSCAIKSPSIAHQLVGSKKLQQVLAKPGVLEKFIKDENAVKRLRDTFAELYSLDMNAAGDAAVKLALERPEGFVLKPQREGGGNNLYDSEMVDRLTEIGRDERRCAYILMEKIIPPVQKNYIIYDRVCSMANTVSELGIFGAFLTNGDEVTNSHTVGHLLRSKSDKHKDGGVAAGVAVLDSPILI